MKKKTPLWIKLISIAVITLSAIVISSMFIHLYLSASLDNDSDITINGKEKFGFFKVYKNTVYVVVPGDGYHPIPLADNKSIRRINNEYATSHIAKDDSHVYCGNKIMPELNSNTVQAIGNNYFTDGKITYYCSRSSEVNEEYIWSISKEYKKYINHYLFNGDKPKKPQVYFYPMAALPDSKTPYYPLLKHQISSEHQIASNGKNAFHEGKLMPKATPNSLHAKPVYRNSDVIQSFRYFGDGKHVYFKNSLLPATDNNDIYGVEVYSRKNEEYLYNPLNGMAYVNDISFDKRNSPYRLISKFGSHVNHTLWLSKNGIYFYNTEEKEMQRAGDNPIINNGFEEIAPLVFANGKETLFIDAYSKWHNTRTNKSLDSNYTSINRLKGLEPNKDWEKLHFFSNLSSIWKHGENWYYFDNAGESQRIFHTIYKIRNEETAAKLLSTESANPTDLLRSLIKSKKLVKAKYKKILHAKTKYDF